MEQKRPQRARDDRRAGPPLLQYRLYFMHGVDTRISHSHEFEAPDDDRAIRIAEAWREGRAAELWSGARKLKSWDSDD